MRIRIGTRSSALALAQSRAVAAALSERGHAPELVTIRTEGDADRTRPFAEIGALGLFVRALETALVERRVDLAVHSYKDLPSRSPDGLAVVAVPAREDPRDRLLARPEAWDGAAWDETAAGLPLRRGARVGTASARRRALVRRLRPDLEVALLRGNVPTRVERLARGEHDAILLAAAGLERLARAGEPLALEGLRTLDLDPDVFVPAPSQGAIACQVRADDDATRAAVAALDDPAAARCVRAERALLARVQAGCEVPFGAHARALDDGSLELVAFLDPEDGSPPRDARVAGPDPDALAAQAFARLRPEAAR